MTTDTAPTGATWRTLGTYAFLSTSDPRWLDAALSLAREVLAEVDRTCSRFRDDSDLVRANAQPGSWVAVDPLLVAAVGVAMEAAEGTEGLVDPCLGRQLVSLGYDADLDQVKTRPAAALSPTPLPRPGAWRELRLDPEGAIRVPDDCALDLGATAKAWAADLVAATVVDALGCGVIVSLGGDIRIDAPEDDPGPGWPVSITERPQETTGAELVWLSGGGLATSSSLVRRWRAGGVEQHHLLDPRTGRPTPEVWRTVTATGSTSVAANTASTAAMVLGADAVDWLEARAVTARLVAADGSVVRTGHWPDPQRPGTHHSREGSA